VAAALPEAVAAARRRRTRRVGAALALLIGAMLALGGILAARGRSAEPLPSEVRRLHDVLHGLGTACVRSGRSRSERRRLDRGVDTILAFARAYPEARFQIDDETGRAVTVLLVAREAVQRCAPDAAARLDEALPKGLRRRSRAAP
jgi:hypothetical protein